MPSTEAPPVLAAPRPIEWTMPIAYTCLLQQIMREMDALDHGRSKRLRRAARGLVCLTTPVVAAACCFYSLASGTRQGAGGGDFRPARECAVSRGFSADYRHADACRLLESVVRRGTSASAPPPPSSVRLCQALGPAAPYPVAGLDCASGVCGELTWSHARPIDWQRYAQGEYAGHARLAHVPDYRLRVDDVLDFVFRLTREPTDRSYRLKVFDRVRVELLADAEQTAEAEIQPDGMITLRLVGQVRAARLTLSQLREVLEERFRDFYRQPTVTVTPLRLNSRLEDLRASIDRRYGEGGQSRRAKVTPEGTVQLPLVHSVSVQGLTLQEAQREIEGRYAEQIDGVEITPVLVTRAPRYVYVLGEVRNPGRYELVAPTTIMQAIALAGGWNYGGNLWNTVVFRRGDDWRLMATRVDLRGSLYGHRPCPADELWINDSDVVLVPKSRVLVAENIIALVFVEGIFRVVPFHAGFFYSTFRYRGTLPNLAVVSGGPGPTSIGPATPAAPAAPASPVTAPAPTTLPTPPIPLPQ
jgi:polysaccharide export outer membrane protein